MKKIDSSTFSKCRDMIIKEIYDTINSYENKHLSIATGATYDFVGVDVDNSVIPYRLDFIKICDEKLCVSYFVLSFDDEEYVNHLIDVPINGFSMNELIEISNAIKRAQIKIEEEEKENVEQHLYCLFENFYHIDDSDIWEMINNIIDDVIDDIHETAAEDFNDDDIEIAFCRVLKKRLCN
jgi:hypothetical protein